MLANPYKLSQAFFKNSGKSMKANSFKKTLKETSLFLADILYNAVIIIVLVVLIRGFLISPFRVVGSSMADTLENKEFILIDKLSYELGHVHRGDPIVFLPPVTSKDTPKFEDAVAMNPAGSGMFDFAGLTKPKDVSYCAGHLLRVFWFCHDRVESGDLLFYAPQEDVAGSPAKETNWNLAKTVAMDEKSVDQGFIQLAGDPGKVYGVRVYSSKGPEYYVKRVIGIPGDKVKIDNGRVYIKRPMDEDYAELNEPYLNQENMDRTYVSQLQQQNVYEVPEGEYFVMGDNRNHSNDSRSWLEPVTQQPYAYVPLANISGKVLIVLWPFGDLHFIPSVNPLPAAD